MKTGKKKDKQLAKIFHSEVYGKRKHKFSQLEGGGLDWRELTLDERMYYFVNIDITGKDEYENGIKVSELFELNGVGLTTAHDDFVISESRKKLLDRFMRFKNAEPKADELYREFSVKRKTGWDILAGWRNLQSESDLVKFVQPITYRPFDSKFVFYEDKLVWRTVRRVMGHFLKGENVALVSARGTKNPLPDHFFVSASMTETKLGESSTQSYVFPLYVYQEDGSRAPNFNHGEIKRFTQKLRKPYEPEDVLDYIYAVLHSPSYREKYKEFLKTDFPRVPAPANDAQFHRLAAFGKELRGLHLLTSSKVNDFVTTYPKDGSSIVEAVSYKDEKVWINKEQYFGGVPEVARTFHIGGYQPAQKWLKDRKGRTLSNTDIEHYQKIIVTLTETDRVMKEIDG